jgi:hypothetical protein
MSGGLSTGSRWLLEAMMGSRRSNPHIILGGPFTTLVPCIDHPARFNQE